MSSLPLYRSLAHYNRWMNSKLYAVTDLLPEEELFADKKAFFGSIFATLNHLLFGDRAWMNRLSEFSYEIKPVGEFIYEDYSQLKDARFQLDRDIIESVDSFTEKDLAEIIIYQSNIYRRTLELPRSILLMHMFNHQTHHRGQLTTLLTQAGYDIGITDLPWSPYVMTELASVDPIEENITAQNRLHDKKPDKQVR